MFTGITQFLLPVVEVNRGEKTLHFGISDNTSVILGASIAVNGVCLTVSKKTGDLVFFDVMQETIEKTNLQFLSERNLVNVEHSLKFGDEIGGHVLSGHISGLAEIVKIENTVENTVMTFRVEAQFMKYIFEKGFIALDGVSLTVTNVNTQDKTFNIWFIPETLCRTTFGKRQLGESVNVEIDSVTQVVVETVERMKIYKK